QPHGLQARTRSTQSTRSTDQLQRPNWTGHSRISQEPGIRLALRLCPVLSIESTCSRASNVVDAIPSIRRSPCSPKPPSRACPFATWPAVVAFLWQPDAAAIFEVAFHVAPRLVSSASMVALETVQREDTRHPVGLGLLLMI